MGKRTDNFTPDLDPEPSLAAQDPHARLLAAVILQATKDAARGRLEARAFLYSEDARLWLELLDIDPEGLAAWLDNGCQLPETGRISIRNGGLKRRREVLH